MEDEYKNDERSITNEQNKEEAINEEDVNTHSVDFIDCPIIEFVIKPEENEEVYIVEFKSEEIDISYHIGESNVKICRSNEEWGKVKRGKLSIEMNIVIDNHCHTSPPNHQCFTNYKQAMIT